MQREEVEQLEILLAELKLGHIDTAIEWLEAAIKIEQRLVPRKVHSGRNGLAPE